MRLKIVNIYDKSNLVLKTCEILVKFDISFVEEIRMLCKKDI